MSQLNFDGSTIEYKNGASVLSIHGVSTLKFWVMEHPKTLIDRYVVVFDMPTDPIQEGVLPAICMNRVGHIFHDEVETGWLSQSIQNSLAPSDPNEYHAIRFEELPVACRKAASREIASMLIGITPESAVSLRKFRVIMPDCFFECYAENETHAAEQAVDANKDGEVQNVILVDYVVL